MNEGPPVELTSPIPPLTSEDGGYLYASAALLYEDSPTAQALFLNAYFRVNAIEPQPLGQLFLGDAQAIGIIKAELDKEFPDDEIELIELKQRAKNVFKTIDLIADLPTTILYQLIEEHDKRFKKVGQEEIPGAIEQSFREYVLQMAQSSRELRKSEQW